MLTGGPPGVSLLFILFFVARVDLGIEEGLTYANRRRCSSWFALGIGKYLIIVKIS